MILIIPRVAYLGRRICSSVNVLPLIQQHNNQTVPTENEADDRDGTVARVKSWFQSVAMSQLSFLAKSGAAKDSSYPSARKSADRFANGDFASAIARLSLCSSLRWCSRVAKRTWANFWNSFGMGILPVPCMQFDDVAVYHISSVNRRSRPCEASRNQSPLAILPQSSNW